MQDDLHDFRRTYEKGTLSKTSVDPNPIQQFRTWFYQALDMEDSTDVNAMTLTTMGTDGYPKGRIILLKKYDAHGFYFYTNYDSDKGKAIAKNEKVSLSFFWPVLERQVIIKGTAKKTSKEVSTAYFNSRPRGSRLGALVSNQSEVIENREMLEDRLKILEKKYRNDEIPKPDNWGGFLVSPLSIEFWQGRPNRLHDRICYTLHDLDWKIERLSP